MATKVVWITMLALADADGVVEASVPGLAATAGVTLEECEAALACFLAPDKYSGSDLDEGRRIRARRGGWVVINHRFYRELRTERQIREAKRIKGKREQAAGNCNTGSTLQHVANVADVAPEAEAEIREDMSSSASPSPDHSPPLDAPKSAKVSADVQRVFDHWTVKLGHPRAKLDGKRERCIRQALKLFGSDDLCRAVDGCALSDFHCGRHEKTKGQRHDDITLICRDAAHIEKFIGLAEGKAGSAHQGEENWL